MFFANELEKRESPERERSVMHMTLVIRIILMIAITNL